MNSVSKTETEFYSSIALFASVRSYHETLLNWSCSVSQDNAQEFDEVQEMIVDLLSRRKEILSRKLTAEQLKDLKQKVSSKIDSGNA